MANKHIRDWLKLPICACIEEFKSLPKHSCGLGIQSSSFIHDKLFLSKRYNLKNNRNKEIQQIWQETRHKHIEIDNLMENRTLAESLHELKLRDLQNSKSHVNTLILQGSICNSIDGVITNKYIQEWSNVIWALPESIFQFSRKSLLQLLPTVSNLHRWKRTDNPSCSLCNKGIRQTNQCSIKLFVHFCPKQIHKAAQCSPFHHSVMDPASKPSKFLRVCRPWRCRNQPDSRNISTEPPPLT